MLGQPKFNRGDEVRFKVADKEKVGCIVVVDKWGTFSDNSDVCYDIMVWEENCVYKHFNEKNVICKCEQVMET